MKNYFTHFILAIIISFPTTAFADFEEARITHLGAVGFLANNLVERLREQNVKKPHRKIMIVFDWDRTISQREGEIDKRRLSEPYGYQDGLLLSTKDLFQHLNAEGFSYFILTARGGGTMCDFEEVHSVVKDMRNTVDLTNPSVIRNKKVKSFSSKDNDEKQILYLEWSSRDIAMVTSHVIFAGTSDKKNSLKAAMLMHLIDNNYFKHKPKYIFFVDNSYRHIRGFRKVFAKRPEQVCALYYPKYGDEDSIAQKEEPQNGRKA